MKGLIIFLEVVLACLVLLFIASGRKKTRGRKNQESPENVTGEEDNN